MATTARLDLSVWRNDDVYEFPLRVLGPDLSGVAMRAQMRLGPDTPGEPLVDLATVANGNEEGIRLAGVTTVDGVLTNDVRIRINKSTRQALPYSGEIGDSAVLKWAFQIAGRTRIIGDVAILAHTIDSDSAPVDRPANYGSASQSGAPAAGATLTIAADSVAELTIDGAELLGPIATAVAGSAAIAAAARDQVLANLGRLINGQAGLGERAPFTRVSPSVTPGAVALSKGLRFVNGSGENSNVYINAPILTADRRIIPVGTKVTVITVWSCTPGFRTSVGAPSNDDKTAFITDQDTGAFDSGTVDTARSGFIGETIYVRATTYTWTADNKRLGQRLTFPNVQAFSGERDITLVSHSIIVDAPPSSYAGSADDLVRNVERERTRLGFAHSVVFSDLAIFTIAQTLPNLLSFVGVRTEQSRARIELPIGEQNAANLALPAYVDVFGHQRERTQISAAQADNVAVGQIPLFEILTSNYSSKIEGVSGFVRNGRYYEHLDNGNTIQDQVIVRENVDYRHQGNAGARAYVTSQGGDPSTVWGSTVPVGIGSSSGNFIRYAYSRLTGESGAVLWHDFKDFRRPAVLELEGNQLLPDSLVSPFLSISTCGSFTTSRFPLIGNTVRGQLAIQGASPWDQTNPALNPADHITGQIDVYGHGNSPFGLLISEPGRCLRIRHATPGAGTVSVTGAAVPLIFGPTDLNRSTSGAAGYRATFDGYLDIIGGGYTSAGAAISLGARLGDRRNSAVTMIVAISGSSAVTVTFNQDYRSQSNATIIAAINAVLGSAGVAYEFSPGARYRPRIVDCEAAMANSGALTMLMGTMVAYEVGGFVCRNAEPGDELAASGMKIGVALEDIAPGVVGRVQTRGLVNIEHLLGDSYDPAALVVGETFKPIQVSNPAVDYYQAKGVLQRRGDALGALRCVRARIPGTFGTPAFLLVS